MNLSFKYKITIFLLLFTSNSEGVVVTLATGINNDAPYVYGDRAIPEKRAGITIDVLKFIEKKLDVNFVIKKRPWKRVVEEVRNNKLDGGFHFSFKEKRKSFVAFPIPKGALLPEVKYSISNRSYFLYKLKLRPVYWDGGSIVMRPNQGMTIGAIRGGSIVEKLKKLGYEVFEVSTDNQLLQLLLQGRVQAIAAIKNMIDTKISALSKLDRDKIVKLDPAIVNKPYYIGFSKKFITSNFELAWKIWNLIDQMKKSGEMRIIINKYVDD